MILSIELSNCGPFKNHAKLSMIPYEYGGKTSNLSLDSRNEQILNTCVIYGKNSAGKTSFIKALWALVQEVRYPTAPNTRLGIYSPFALDVDSKDESSELKLSFSMNGNTYLYCIIFNAVEFLYECLLVTTSDGKQDKLFERDNSVKYVLSTLRDCST